MVEVKILDKYEYNLKLEEINKLVENDNYEDAARLADTVDWKRVRNIRTLCMVSEIYEANDRLEDSRAVLLRAYRRSQNGRMLLYRLTEIAIKMGEFDEAIEYYSEFVNIAPNDNSRYVLKYKIYKGRGSSLQDQITILEEYKEKEYTEKWAYELARLYYKAGEDQKCIEECDDLVLWFHQGRYVIKALELKRNLAPLSEQQQAIYDHKGEHVPNQAEMVEAAVPKLEKIITETMPTSEEEAITDSIISATEKELAQAVTQHTAEVQEEKAAREPVFHVETLQKELADSMREIVAGMTRKESDEGIIEPMNDKPFREETVQTGIASDQGHSAGMDGSPRENIDDVLTAMAVQSAADGEVSGQMPKASVVEFAQTAVKTSEIELTQTAAAAPDVTLAQSTATASEEESAQVSEASNEEPHRNSSESSGIELQQNPAASATEEVRQSQAEIAVGDTLDLAAALERAAGVENMRPENAKPAPQPVKEEQKEVSRIIPQLTQDEQRIFSYFSSVRGLREQIALALEEAKHKVKLDRTSRSGNIVITGLPGSGRTTLGIRFAKVLSKFKGEKSARIAKIYAEDFNKKDIPSTIAKIAGGTLIIEEAGDLEDGVVKQLAKAMEFRTDGLIVILEDEKHLLKALFDKHPELAEKFTSEVTIPIFTNDELVAFGKMYAFDEDFRIEDMATMTLYNRIGELQTPEHPVTVLDVKDIVDKAIRHSEKFGFRKLGMILSKKRYDEDDRIILYEKDFK